jgi:hemerythrin HHE cation binding domain-containing protein
VRSQDWYMTTYAGDVVEYLTDQHEEIRTLLGRVLPASGRDRQRAFDAVRELLARHEAAEESVLRPLVRAVPSGEEEAAHRTREEARAQQTMDMLEQLDVGSIPFTTMFREFEEAVLGHAEKEQEVEFTLLRQAYDPETLRRARVAVEAVEADESGDPSATEVHGGTFAARLHRARRLIAHVTP